jgi:hypothetical protein
MCCPMLVVGLEEKLGVREREHNNNNNNNRLANINDTRPLDASACNDAADAVSHASKAVKTATQPRYLHPH